MKEVTDQYQHLFPEDKEPVSIYFCDNKELGYGNRVIVKARKLLGGSNGGGEYCNMPFIKHIKVSENIEEPKRTEVVKHEVNHYLSDTAEKTIDDITRFDKLFAANTAIVLLSSLAVQFNPVFSPVVLTSFVAMIGMILYDAFFLEEKTANEGTMFEEKEKTLKDYTVLVVGLSALPLRILTFPKQYYQFRHRLTPNQIHD